MELTKDHTEDTIIVWFKKVKLYRYVCKVMIWHRYDMILYYMI